jgi:hypothetical protein
MKKIILVSLFIVGALYSFAQKTINAPNAEKRNVSGYHEIAVSGGIDLYLTPGAESCVVSASEPKYVDRIITEVVGGVLKIYFENKTGINIEWGSRKMKAIVSYSRLDKLTASGGSDVTIDGTLKSPSLGIRLSGGSDFNGKIESDDLKIDASGGSDLDISGSAAKLDLIASGGSDFKGYEMSADVCTIEANGGSDIYITVNREMNANASGGSDVYYKGNGAVKDMRSSGSSSIKKTSK